jgi:hypothetical protein
MYDDFNNKFSQPAQSAIPTSQYMGGEGSVTNGSIE